MSFITLLLLSTNLIKPLFAYWNTITSKLPNPDQGFAVGLSNDTIYIIGGTTYGTQVTGYDIDTQSFDDYGATLSVSIRGLNQFWTQDEDMLYMIEDDDSSTQYLATFDLNTLEFTAQSVTFDAAIDSRACLTSSIDQLYVVADSGATSNSLQVLNLLTDEWTLYEQVMNDARGYHSCTVNNNYLWAMGGIANDDSYLSTVERISIADPLSTNTWSYTDSLSIAVYSTRALSYGDEIYVIGGNVDAVHVIDAMDGSVTISPFILPYDISASGMILVDDIIYLFGGTIDDTATDSMVYFRLGSTFNPTVATQDPSTSPSSQPSISPTKAPIVTVTSADTEAPETPNDNSTQKSKGGTTGLVVGLLILMIVMVFVLAFLVRVYWKNNQKAELELQDRQLAQNMQDEMLAKDLQNNAVQQYEQETLEMALAMSLTETGGADAQTKDDGDKDKAKEDGDKEDKGQKEDGDEEDKAQKEDKDDEKAAEDKKAKDDEDQNTAKSGDEQVKEDDAVPMVEKGDTEQKVVTAVDDDDDDNNDKETGDAVSGGNEENGGTDIENQ